MKNIIIKLTFVLCACVLSLTQINAQNATAPWSIGLSGGKSAYNGDLGNAFFNFDQPYQGIGGLKIGRYINPSLDVSLDGTYGRYGFWENSTDQFLSNMLQGNLTLDYKLNNGYILSEDAVIAPYIFGGLGFANISHEENEAGTARAADGTDIYIPLGLGATVNITPNVGLFWQGTYGGLNFNDERDFLEVGDNNDQFMLNQVGLKFNIGSGGIKDADGDGIADNKDACPNTPAGPNGYKGCPDSDGDGLIDRADDCPNTFGERKYKGCPDTDGDGVMDKIDDCPDVAGAAKFKGCPDTDGDGIADNIDECPNQRGTRSNRGCPVTTTVVVEDTDGDGIPNSEDQCPSVAGPASNRGCPVLSQEVQTVFEEALRGIQFETAKAVIKSASYPILNNVVRVMQNNPTYKLSIEGHTDSQGSEASNLDLSQRRAEAVRLYLVNNGIAASRMTATGYGESIPVADNNTPEGRALNRRVEFKVSY